MAGNAGLLVVSLGLNAVEFFSGLSKAEYEARKSMAAIAHSVNVAKEAFRIIGVGIGVEAFRELVDGSIKAQAELGRLATRAGTTVEELSSMRVAAHEGGVGLDQVALASTRLSKAVFEGQDKSTKAAQALELIGLKAKDLVKLPTAQAFQTVAKALDGFNESSGKTGVQMEILGKSGPKMAAFLKALAENGTVAANVTTEMANAAREAELKIFNLTDSLSVLRNKGVNALVPSLNAVVDAFNELAKSSEGNIGLFQSLGELLRVTALGLVTIYEGAKGLLRLSITIANVAGALGSLNKAAAVEEWKKYEIQTDKNNEAFIRFYDTLAKGSPLLTALAGREPELPKSIMDRSAQYAEGYTKGDKYYGERPKKKEIPPLPVTGNDDPTRKILEAALAALKANTEQEKAVLDNRNNYLHSIFEQGESTIADYYAQKQAAQDEDIRRTSANYLEEIRLIDVFIRNAGTARAKAEGEKEKIAVTAKQNLFVTQAAGRAQQILDEQNRTTKDYLRTLDDVNARMLELQGNTAAAARIRFDAQNEDLQKRLAFTIASPTSTPEQVARARQDQDRLSLLGQATVAQARLNDVTQLYGFVTQKVGIEQGKIDLQLQTGAITEIDAINKRAELSQQYIGILQQQLAVQEQIAASEIVPGPQRVQALLNVQKLRLEIEQLASASDVLAKKFNDIFASGFSTFLTDLVNGTKSAKQAFLDMAKSIEQSISKIASDQISQSLFGKGGAFGDVGGFFAEMFGGKKQESSIQGAGDFFSKLIDGLQGKSQGGKDKTVSATDALAAIGITGFKTDASLLGVASAADITSAALLKLSFASSSSGGLGDAIQSAITTGFGKGNESLGDVLGLLGDVPFVGGGKEGGNAQAALATSTATATVGLGTFTTALATAATAAGVFASSAGSGAIGSAFSAGFGKGNENLGDVLGLFGDVPFVGGGKEATAGNSALAASQTASTAALGAFTAGLGLAVEGTAASVIGLTALTAGLETAAAAALQFATSASASGAGGGIGDLFGGGGGGGGFGTGSAFGNQDFGLFLAGGGIPPLGKISVVGENGPELFIPRTAGTVIPSSVMAQKRAEKQTVNLHYYAAPGVSKQTAHQHAVDMARTIDTARKLNR